MSFHLAVIIVALLGIAAVIAAALYSCRATPATQPREANLRLTPDGLVNALATARLAGDGTGCGVHGGIW